MYFKYGLIVDGIRYGWYKKELYRLPFKSFDNRFYYIKKLNSILIRNKIGYRLSSKRYTIDKLKYITNIIDMKIIYHIGDDLPF